MFTHPACAAGSSLGASPASDPDVTMDVLTITCPKCARGLKVKDRNLLGRKGRCPACGHSFVLQADEELEVELRLAEREIPVGTAAQWVPDELPAATPASVTAAVVVAPAAAADADATTARLRELRRQQARRRKLAIAAGAVTAIIVFGVFLAVRSFDAGDTQAASTRADNGAALTPADPTAVSPALSKAGNVWNLTESQRQSNARLVDAARPTNGDPIGLYMMPSGVNLVIHLRPARLWSDDSAYTELRYTLTGNVTDWITEQLKAVCRREPAQIDEALIGVILGARGTPPQVAAVVHLVEEARLSDLIEEFKGEPIGEESGLRMYRAEKHAYLIRDTKTFAICPAEFGDELANWIARPNHQTTEGILQLLKQTDRERLLTVLMEVDDVRRHQAELFPPEAAAAIARVLDAFSDDAETACWSVNVGDTFHSDLQFRTRLAEGQEILTPERLVKSLNEKLGQAPHDLMSMILKMHPPRKGAATIIGRYPAMVEAYRQATVPTTDKRLVRLTTVLPARSAPNLALATLLTWDEARRTDFSIPSRPAATVAAADANLPDTVAERLKLTIDAEFSRTPLQEALRYICGEIQINLDLDGEALMSAAYTQNMPQTFNLGKVPASAAIHEIIKNYDGNGNEENRMVVSVDEQTKSLIVHTRKFADQKGLTVFSVGPAQ